MVTTTIRTALPTVVCPASTSTLVAFDLDEADLYIRNPYKGSGIRCVNRICLALLLAVRILVHFQYSTRLECVI